MLKLQIERLECIVYRAPIDVPVVAAFGTSHNRPVVLIRIEDKDGAHGWGEIWCNFPNIGAENRARWIETLIGPKVIKRSFNSPKEAFDLLTGEMHNWAIQSGEAGTIAQCLAGIDIAMWDLVARKKNTPLRKMLSQNSLDSVKAYASGINPTGSWETVQRARDIGFRNFKLKIGFNREDDLFNISQVASKLAVGERLMVDANQAWNLEVASEMVQQMSDMPLIWLEEPLPADAPTDDWKALKKTSSIRLAAGENLRGVEAYRNLLSGGWCTFVQPDACKWGGVTGCWRVIQMIAQAGLIYCPHFLAGGIGLIASGHLLAAAGGTGLLEVDINENPLREGLATPYPALIDGNILLNSSPGLGVEPDLGLVKSLQVMHIEIN